MKNTSCTGALVLFLVVVVVVSTLLGANGSTSVGGSADASPFGLRALVAILNEVGLDAAGAKMSPKELAESDVPLVVLPAVPEENDRDVDLGHAFSSRWYGEFADRGGDLVLPIAHSADLNFARDFLDVGGLGVHLELGSYASSRDVMLSASAGREVGSGVEWLHIEGAWDPSLDVTLEGQAAHDVTLWRCYEDYDGERKEAGASVAIFARGEGRVILLAAPQMFENRDVVVADNALLFVRLMEYLQGTEQAPGRVLFDDSLILGLNYDSWTKLLFLPPLLPATLACLLALSFFVWSISARRTFPLDRRLARRPAPVQRAHALASLMVRAGHPEWIDSALEMDSSPTAEDQP